MTKKQIKVGIVALGYAAKTFHLPLLKIHGGFQVSAVYQRQINKEAQNDCPNAQFFDNYDDFLAQDIDLVIITSPNLNHFVQAKKALEAGKHVVVEKPLAVYADEAKRLNQLAKEKNCLLSVFQNRRWDSAVLSAQEVLNHHLIGDLIEFKWSFDRFSKEKNKKLWKETGEKGVGLVYDLGVHLLDGVVALFGLPQAIYADIRYQHPDVLGDDYFVIDLDYQGFKATVSARKYAREPEAHLRMHGRLGSYVIQNADLQEEALKMGEYDKIPVQNACLHSEMNGVAIRCDLPAKKGNYLAYYENIYSALMENDLLAVSANQAINVLILIEKAYESAKLACKISLDESMFMKD